MPTTVSSLFLFVALLAPGFVFLARTESRLPGQKLSTLRETAVVVSTSLLSNLVILAGFGLLRMLWPGAVLDVGAAVRNPGEYFRDHYVEVSLWSVGVLGLSSLLAAFIATPPSWIERLLERSGSRAAGALLESVHRRRRSAIAPESGWGIAFHRYPDRIVHLGLRLRDGTYLYGRLMTFNPQIEETGGRSLQLAGPVDIRTPSAGEINVLDADVVVVSADEIKTISVHYLPESASVPDAATP